MDGELLRPHLAPGEAVTWSGRPDAGELARRGLAGALMTAAASAAFAWMGPRFGFQGAILAVPWAFCALSLASPLFTWRRASGTVYAVTDRRALIVTGGRVKSFGAGRLGHPTVRPRSGALSDVEFGVETERRSGPDGTSHETTHRIGFLAITGAQAAEGALRELLSKLSRAASQQDRLHHPVLGFSFVAPPGWPVTSVEPRLPAAAKRGFSFSFLRKADPAEVRSTDWGALVLTAAGGASCRVEVRARAERPTLEALSAEAGGSGRWVLGKPASAVERDVPPFGKGYELVHALPMGIQLRQVICFPPGFQVSFSYANRQANADLYGPFLDAMVRSLELDSPAA